MKKLILLSLTILFNFAGFAQRISHVQEQSVAVFYPENTGNYPLARTTATGDTLKLSNMPATDTIVLYKVGSKDSGYVTGPNYWGDKAFAERYDINGLDSSVSVLGVFTLFGGKVNLASSNTVYLNVWNTTPVQPITGSILYNGFPQDLLNTVNVPVTNLGIGTTVDTLKKFLFASPTMPIGSSFFVGYSMGYSFATLNGDTICLASSKNGERKPTAVSTLVFNTSAGDTTLDTIINVQNATQGADNYWYDNYTQNDSIKNNLAVYPIVVIGTPNAVKGVTRNGFTFYGNFPNPADHVTNIRFALNRQADITVQVMDMTGRVVNTISQHEAGSGEQTIAVSTADLATGDYLYLVRTSSGDGIAGKITVKH